MDDIVKGMTHKEMLAIMMDAGIFCSPDKFARILADAQVRAIQEVRDTCQSCAIDLQLAKAGLL